MNFMQTHTNEIEKAYNKILSYKKEVADFLLYVTGSHSNHEHHWIESLKKLLFN